MTADCPICSKGTVFDSARSSAPRRRSGSSSGSRSSKASPVFKGPHSGAGPYEDDDGASYTIRLERVPGGVRLAEWDGSRLRRRAPVLASADLPALLRGSRDVLADRDADALELAASAEPDPDAPAVELVTGISRGRSGDFKEELRVESLDGGRVRIARWVLRPGLGWELQDAAPMLPAKRFAEAVTAAVRQGLSLASDPAPPPRP